MKDDDETDGEKEDKEMNFLQPPWVAAVLAAENFSEATKIITSASLPPSGKFRKIIEKLLPGHHYVNPPWTAYVISSPSTVPPNALETGAGILDIGDGTTYVTVGGNDPI